MIIIIKIMIITIIDNNNNDNINIFKNVDSSTCVYHHPQKACLLGGRLELYLQAVSSTGSVFKSVLSVCTYVGYRRTWIQIMCWIHGRSLMIAPKWQSATNNHPNKFVSNTQTCLGECWIQTTTLILSSTTAHDWITSWPQNA